MNNGIPRLQGYMIFNGRDGKRCSGLEHLICTLYIRGMPNQNRTSTIHNTEVLPLEIKIVLQQMRINQMSVL